MLDSVRVLFGMRWTQFSWAMYHWLASPWRVTLAIAGFALALGLLQPRLRRRLRRGILAVLLAYWLVVSPLFSVTATRLLMAAVPADRGQSAQVIVVQAREQGLEGDRQTVALDMLAAGRADRLLMIGDLQSKQAYEALQQRGLPDAALLGLTCARTTKQEAEMAAAVLGTRSLNQIILITDQPHMLRSWLTFKSLGFAVIPHMVPLPPQVSSPDRAFLAMREFSGLLSYALLGRFRPQPPEDLPQRAAALAEGFPMGRCLVTAADLRRRLSSQG